MKSKSDTIDIREDILDTAQVIMSSKGFSGVGLTEILSSVGVPKGSFYHYFSSKEAFGEALLQRYFDNYLADMDVTFGQVGQTSSERLQKYWQNWLETQTTLDPQSKCLVVKLAAEVADLSEGMRHVLLQGTSQIIARIAEVIEQGVTDGSLKIEENPKHLAETLYHCWLGASLLAKITKDDVPLITAMQTTKTLLNTPA
ncbi:MAG: TetR/AcrR family transcriptional regulator [Rhizobiaceae bacterium]|nr:TetR/AcrR family transcriptional regulator [Rhizobiaceae bacterium]